MSSYKALYHTLRQALASAFEAEQLFAHATGRRSYELPHIGEETAPDCERELLLALLARRSAGEPLQYLLGEWEFYGLPFAVGKGVLIPRADTETLVDAALEQAKAWDAKELRILDLCSGSGAVAVALAHLLPTAQVTAVELSCAAFGYLRQNIDKNQVQAEAVQMDLYRYSPPLPLHIITANPPYIPSGEIAHLQNEVRHEPVTALDGGADGLDFYRGIINRAAPWLEPGGSLLFEVGIGQAQSVAALMEQAGLKQTELYQDLGGISRVVSAKHG